MVTWRQIEHLFPYNANRLSTPYEHVESRSDTPLTFRVILADSCLPRTAQPDSRLRDAGPARPGTNEEERVMDHVVSRKLMSNAFNKLHEQLSVVRSHVEAIEDQEAARLFDAMEFGLLAPMRKLRVHLDIPYDWHERRPTAAGAAQ